MYPCQTTFSAFTLRAVAALFICGLLTSRILVLPALAGTHEQILENCRNTVGRPHVQACMAGKRGDAAALAACRESAKPIVHACLIREEQRIAAGKPAPAAPAPDQAA